MNAINRSAPWWLAAAAVLLSAGPAGSADDDLAVVKKAVAAPQVPVAEPSAPQELPLAAAPRKTGKSEPQWLRVRVLERNEKGEERKRVSVNVPLSLVRALEDFPIDICRHHGHGDAKEPSGRRCDVKLADVLAALEAGQELVEVEGDNETVKIWLE